jgi:hypothetical protein
MEGTGTHVPEPELVGCAADEEPHAVDPGAEEPGAPLEAEGQGSELP